MKVTQKTDYSTLFSSMNNSSSGSNALTDLSWLSDYSSIKSGTYGKLMKAYYSSDASKSEDKASPVASASTINPDTKAFTQTATDADALQSSVKKLGKLNSESGDEDIKSAVSSYVKDYNALMDSASGVSDTSIDGRLTSIKGYTAEKKDALADIGISIGSDNKLTLDTDTLAKADKSKVASLFADKGSYGYSVSVSAAMIQSSANYDAAKTSTYTSTGTYSSVVGSLWDSTT